MSKTFNTIDEFIKYAQKNIVETLGDEVNKTVRNKLKENVEEEVYDKYTPSENGYQRTGGLLQDRNIESKVEGNTLSVRSTRNEDGKDVAAIVEYGVGYDWESSRIYQMQPFPRPFHAETSSDLAKTNEHVEAMKKGLKKRGFNTN